MYLEKTNNNLKSECYEVIFLTRVWFLACYQSGWDQEHKSHLLSGCTFVFQCQIVPRQCCCHISLLAFHPSPFSPHPENLQRPAHLHMWPGIVCNPIIWLAGVGSCPTAMISIVLGVWDLPSLVDHLCGTPLGWAIERRRKSRLKNVYDV